MLHVVPPIPKPDDGPNTRRKRAAKPEEVLQCRRCSGREVIETVIGASVQGGKLKGGTRQIICVTCMLKGERVLLG
ncbi:MAG: hypothetical protein V4724_26615 [Pseudomonadota bacterium]